MPLSRIPAIFRIILSVLCLGLLLLASPAAAAQNQPAPAPKDALEGTWDVSGWEPGLKTTAEPSYTGQVQLHKRGDGYAFDGIIDGGEYFGVGLYDPEAKTLSLAFQGPSGEDAGLAVFKVKGDTLEGHWLYQTDEEGQIGTEVWHRTAAGK
ncbi:hypothetical protein dsx2_1291 [Desulfovibrio sp. X2]|uniref:hypothetical protein n=1 Tax=Desulfovibrio sp. X2 TaxID=941449 RepID=UPI000358E8F7|nr:hypothetical protein [Desulfovibrio sp. X2]EPR44663.1 hypothetical protein dsx2_1291 [Desulfovibrio sp. X2]